MLSNISGTDRKRPRVSDTRSMGRTYLTAVIGTDRDSLVEETLSAAKSEAFSRISQFSTTMYGDGIAFTHSLSTNINYDLYLTVLYIILFLKYVTNKFAKYSDNVPGRSVERH